MRPEQMRDALTRYWAMSKTRSRFSACSSPNSGSNSSGKNDMLTFITRIAGVMILVDMVRACCKPIIKLINKLRGSSWASGVEVPTKWEKGEKISILDLFRCQIGTYRKAAEDTPCPCYKRGSVGGRGTSNHNHPRGPLCGPLWSKAFPKGS